jgi:hypothetical protein
MFVLLGAETIAAFQVLIYVGVTVLILYGVMFTKSRRSARCSSRSRLAAAVFVAAVRSRRHRGTVCSRPSPRPGGGDLRGLRRACSDRVSFETHRCPCFAAMVGAIVLTRRDDPEEDTMAPPMTVPLGAYIAVSAVLFFTGCAGARPA